MNIGNLLLPIISSNGTVSTIPLSSLKIAESDLYFETNICEGGPDIRNICEEKIEVIITESSDTTYRIAAHVNGFVSRNCEEILYLGPFKPSGLVTIYNNTSDVIDSRIQVQESRTPLRPGESNTRLVQFPVDRATSAIRIIYSLPPNVEISVV